MPRSLIAALPVVALSLAAACGPTAPAPAETGKAPPAAAATPAPAPAAPAPEAPAPTAAADAPEAKREPPLTPEEIQLIESDPKTLTPEQRRARAHALRRKILQNPDSPAAKQLEQLRKDVESGAVVPALPGSGGASSSPGGDLTLQARPPSEPAEPAKAP